MTEGELYKKEIDNTERERENVRKESKMKEGELNR
jgi:hypothetical protein